MDNIYVDHPANLSQLKINTTHWIKIVKKFILQNINYMLKSVSQFEETSCQKTKLKISTAKFV